MSDNSLLVQFFVKEIFKNNAAEAQELTYLIDPYFEYYLDTGIRMNYVQFIAKVKKKLSTATVELGKIDSENDTHFYCDFEISFPDQDQAKKIYGLSQIIIDSGFISQITINYHKNVQEFNEFRDILEKKNTVYL